MFYTDIMIVCINIGAAGAPPAPLARSPRYATASAATAPRRARPSVRVIEQQDSLDGRRLPANMKKRVKKLCQKHDSGNYIYPYLIYYNI